MENSDYTSFFTVIILLIVIVRELFRSPKNKINIKMLIYAFMGLCFPLVRSFSLNMQPYALLGAQIIILLTSFSPILISIFIPKFHELVSLKRNMPRDRFIIYLIYSLILFSIVSFFETLYLSHSINAADFIKKLPIPLLLATTLLTCFFVAHSLFKLEEKDDKIYKNEALYPENIYQFVSIISNICVSFSTIYSLFYKIKDYNFFAFLVKYPFILHNHGFYFVVIMAILMILVFIIFNFLKYADKTSQNWHNNVQDSTVN